MFKSRIGNKRDYHDSMIHDTFRVWFKNNLLPSFPLRSPTIMDNASHHSIIMNKTQTLGSRKEEIIECHSENNFPHNPGHTKPELLLQVKTNRNVQICETDQIASNHDHQVLRLPPYHGHLNPIELVWAQVKTDVKKRNSHSEQTLRLVEQTIEKTQQRIQQKKPDKCV